MTLSDDLHREAASMRVQYHSTFSLLRRAADRIDALEAKVRADHHVVLELALDLGVFTHPHRGAVCYIESTARCTSRQCGVIATHRYELPDGVMRTSPEHTQAAQDEATAYLAPLAAAHVEDAVHG